MSDWYGETKNRVICVIGAVVLFVLGLNARNKNLTTEIEQLRRNLSDFGKHDYETTQTIMTQQH